eukprot:TRINITY_DN33356_c0_g1_i1.p1 TRINITY_DN33356_c0_g1~~TRINITY_DN33356_c0_g1_i1.p1  ORF type:complete len:1158 (-),score=200.92 TRINITY_DN33356_c0_g1_i1:157-3630(-)
MADARDGVNDPRPCPICLEDEIQDPVVCPCAGRHVFCRECLGAARALSCPMCRDASQQVASFLFGMLGPESRRPEWMRAQMAQAAAAGTLQVIRALLDWRCSVNSADDEGWTPLQHASNSNQRDAVRCLLEAQANVNQRVSMEHEEGETALVLAAMAGHVETTKLLVEARACLHATFEDETPLLHACWNSNMTVFKYLLEQNALLSDTTPEGETALHIAAFNNDSGLVSYLLSEHAASVDIHARCSEGETALHFAAKSNHWEFLDLVAQHVMQGEPLPSDLLHETSPSGSSALHLAAMCGHTQMVDSLLKHRALASLELKEGWSALHLGVLANYSDIVERLLAARAALEACHERYHRIPEFEDMRWSEGLALQPGAFVDLVNPLEVQLVGGFSVTLQAGLRCCVKELIDQVNPDEWGNDVAEVSAFCGCERVNFKVKRFQIVKELSASPLQLYDRLTVGTEVCIVSFITFLNGVHLLPGDRGVVKAVCGTVPPVTCIVHVFAARNQPAFEFGAAPEQLVRTWKMTALQDAAMHGHRRIAQLLIAARANLEAGPQTPLQLAVEYGHADVVADLHEAKARLDGETPGGFCTLELAASGGSKEVVQYLISHMWPQPWRNLSAAVGMAYWLGHRELMDAFLGAPPPTLASSACCSMRELAAIAEGILGSAFMHAWCTKDETVAQKIIGFLKPFLRAVLCLSDAPLRTISETAKGILDKMHGRSVADSSCLSCVHTYVHAARAWLASPPLSALRPNLDHAEDVFTITAAQTIEAVGHILLAATAWGRSQGVCPRSTLGPACYPLARRSPRITPGAVAKSAARPPMQEPTSSPLPVTPLPPRPEQEAEEDEDVASQQATKRQRLGEDVPQEEGAPAGEVPLKYDITDEKAPTASPAEWLNLDTRGRTECCAETASAASRDCATRVELSSADTAHQVADTRLRLLVCCFACCTRLYEYPCQGTVVLRSASTGEHPTTESHSDDSGSRSSEGTTSTVEGSDSQSQPSQSSTLTPDEPLRFERLLEILKTQDAQLAALMGKMSAELSPDATEMGLNLRHSYLEAIKEITESAKSASDFDKARAPEVVARVTQMTAIFYAQASRLLASKREQIDRERERCHSDASTEVARCSSGSSSSNTMDLDLSTCFLQQSTPPGPTIPDWAFGR